jgi:alginate O-acetyltransferase complex protein AlgJ
MKLAHYILLIGFLVIISFPLLNRFVLLLPDIENTENRRQTSFPHLDTCKMENISKSLESYLTDNISIRNRMIKAYNHLNIFVFRSSPVSIKAIVGKNGWYFMSGEEIRTYTGTNLFKDNELLDLTNELIKRKKIMENYGAKLVIAIVPNKSNIYPEYMPAHLTKADMGYGKQVLQHLQKNNFSVIDLYSPLLAAKSERELYYHTDNHWNDYGAFVAANTVLQNLKQYNHHIKPLSLSDYPIKTIIEKGGNIAKLFSIEEKCTETNYIPMPQNGLYSIEKKQNKYPVTRNFPYPNEFELTRYAQNDSLPTVLIIRDSFGTKFYPYLSEQCKKCVTIYDNWEYGLNENIIKSERPNFVLLLVLESNLRNIVKYKK